MQKKSLKLKNPLSLGPKEVTLQTPVSTWQIKVLKIAWRKTFGRELEVLENIKQRVLNELFIKIHQKQCKIQ
ncbi:hypothetical protein BF38_5518 (plasmid) [Bacillus thuringiensis]|uniref:Transposase n=1 Tax=Bacillus thuringiensis TaxID=1428 RepID=A0AB33B6G6_BACTU|nr:hypothetical protein BF38_5518 [Bacillus thuringiensis]